MMRLLCLLLCFLAMSSMNLLAQQSPFSVGLQAGVSYSGWNLALVGQYHLNDFSGYVGPSLTLNRGAIGKGPMGLNAGLNYHLPNAKKWLGSLVNLDYQLHFFKPGDIGTARIQEFHLSYGLEFRITESFSLIQQMGYGFYLESNPMVGGGRRSLSGYGGLLRLKAGYRF
jgi:hypothetical protein